MGYLSERTDEHYNGLIPLYNLHCPISGVPLIEYGKSGDVMDGDTFYYSFPLKGYIYARHPFMYDFFRLVTGYNNCEQGTRFFKLLEDKTWQEYIGDKRTDQLFPIGTPKSEINKVVQKERKERKERKRLYDEGVANGTITPLPKGIRIAARLIEQDKVTVQPLSPPTGKIYF